MFGKSFKLRLCNEIYQFVLLVTSFPFGFLVLGFLYTLCAQSTADLCGFFINKNFFSNFTLKCFFKLCHGGHRFQIPCSSRLRFHWPYARIFDLRKKNHIFVGTNLFHVIQTMITGSKVTSNRFLSFPKRNFYSLRASDDLERRPEKEIRTPSMKTSFDFVLFRMSFFHIKVCRKP